MEYIATLIYTAIILGLNQFLLIETHALSYYSRLFDSLTSPASKICM